MERKQPLFYTLFGFVLGVLLTADIWSGVSLREAESFPVSPAVSEGIPGRDSQ